MALLQFCNQRLNWKTEANAKIKTDKFVELHCMKKGILRNFQHFSHIYILDSTLSWTAGTLFINAETYFGFWFVLKISRKSCNICKIAELWWRTTLYNGNARNPILSSVNCFLDIVNQKNNLKIRFPIVFSPNFYHFLQCFFFCRISQLLDKVLFLWK